MYTISDGRIFLASLAVTASMAVGTTTLADSSPSSPFSIASAMEQLSSPDYADRRKAIKAVESYLAAQDAAWLNTQDVEVQEQVATALQFNRQLTSWLLELNKASEVQKREGLTFLTGPELAPILGQLFSEDPDTRVQGVHKLAGIHVVGADQLLAHFLRDDEPAVSIGTMEILWDRNPSEATIQGLWNVGVGDQVQAFLHPTPQPPTTTRLMFRGEPLTVPAHMGYAAIVDPKASERFKAEAARIVLAHLKTPEVEGLINKSLQDVADTLKSPDETSGVFSNYLRKQVLWDTLLSLSSIGEECGFKSSIPGFFALATVPVTKEREIGFSIAGGPAPAYYSIRTSALLTVLLLTAQHPSDYGMLEGKERSPVWATPNRGSEDQAVEKLKGWWKQK
jgi:hypothetical protein